ncbi:uncharacterized protein LOC130246654 [Danio aesculapii]|uniref:uncharacterized protein LOC130246654 n=1 Tax=Danio aesculapii TaxID=1142201 RepID=UPI0024BF9AB3|nr:uncharacterized protein LOC130246654 [Danio aesculapii]
MKTLAVISLTAFLCCCDVQSAEQSHNLEQQILNSGTVLFLDFVEKVKYATEKLIQDDQFAKSRITFQGYMKALRVSAKEMSNPESAGESHGNSDIPIQRFVTVAVVTLRQMTRDVFDRFFSPYFEIYSETLKKVTIRGIWKEVDSYYFPGAPPINSKPMEFLGYLMGKAVVKSRIVRIVEAAVGAIGKADINQFNENMLMALTRFRIKAIEISFLEKQQTNNNFLVSLRTVSGLIVFYWDEFLEYTESHFFMKKCLDSVTKWQELTQLRNPSEQHHVILNLDVWREIRNWIEHGFGDFLHQISSTYFFLGTSTLGSERYERFNRAVLMSPVVYSLPVYEKLSEADFGFTEINRFLNRVDNVIYMLIEDYARDKQESLTLGISRILIRFDKIIKEEKDHAKPNPERLPLRLIRRTFLGSWMMYHEIENEIYVDTTQTEIESEWNNAKKIIINEMVKSKAFTRKQLEEAPNDFVEALRQLLNQMKQENDLAEGFDELIDPITLSFKRWMYTTNKIICEFWELLLD